MPIPDSWLPALVGETTQPYYQQLYRFIGEERRKYKVYPPGEDVFNALRYTPFEQRARGDYRARSVSRRKPGPGSGIFGAPGGSRSPFTGEYL